MVLRVNESFAVSFRDESNSDLPLRKEGGFSEPLDSLHDIVP
jgi:hypothetical protein